MNRRTLIKAFPFIGAAVAMPVAASDLTPEQRIANAIAELRAGMADLGHAQYMAMIREESDSKGGGFAHAVLFDNNGKMRGRVELA